MTSAYSYKRLFYTGLLVPMLVQGRRIAMEVDTREMEDEAAKNSILMYDPEIVQNIKGLEDSIKEICNCNIEHLPSIQTFILHYEDSGHLPASTFSSLPGIIFSNEDEIILPPDDETDDPDNRMVIDVRTYRFQLIKLNNK